MAYIEVISPTEGKKYLALAAYNSATPTEEDLLVKSLCEAISEEVRTMTNRSVDADFLEIHESAKVQHVAKEMLQWYFHQTRQNGDRLGLVNIADTMQGASATTSYENAEAMDKRWQRKLRPFRIFPI
jgi:hypothetical protein